MAVAAEDYSVTNIKAVIGLGNPGARFERTRHNIGFRVVDALAQQHGSGWSERDDMASAQITVLLSTSETDPLDTEVHTLLLIKPLTFMNASGRVMSLLTKKGIKPDKCVVVHDELEKKFSSLAIRFGGSARGHNGLRSVIGTVGPEFWRLRFGIGRPEDKADVGDYVLRPFSTSEEQELPELIETACRMLVS